MIARESRSKRLELIYFSKVIYERCSREDSGAFFFYCKKEKATSQHQEF